MTLLEDRLTQILELKISGKSDKDISKELGLETKLINEYEDSLKRLLNRHRHSSVEGIARKLDISPILVGMAKSYYGNKTEHQPRILKRKISGRKIRPFSETIEEIRRLAAEGLKKEEIASKLGYSPATIQVYSYRGNVTELLPQKPHQSHQNANVTRKEKNIERLNELIDKGIVSYRELAERSGIGCSTIYGYRTSGFINLPEPRRGRKTITGEPSEELIKRSIDGGAKSMEEICIRTGLSLSTIQEYCRESSIKIPTVVSSGEFNQTGSGLNLTTYKRRSNIDKLVQQGFTLNEIGKKIDVTRERIRQYIIETGQASEFRKLRSAKKTETSVKRKKGLLQDIKILITKKLEQSAKQEGWAYEKAVEYLNARKQQSKNSTSFENLVELFQRYENAVKSGNKLSLHEISEGILPYYSYATRILKAVGLKPMYGSWDRHITPKEKKDAIKRAKRIEMSGTDIAYFLNLPSYVVNSNLKIYGGKSFPHHKWVIKQFGNPRDNNRAFLTYKLASQIYEAKDLRFKIGDITELLDTRRDVIGYALENRYSIERKIINGLRTLYETKKINKPYVRDKEKVEFLRD